ncbi:hypothetical protein ACRBEV_29605 [Methylobacterium phyllosphaerae]
MNVDRLDALEQHARQHAAAISSSGNLTLALTTMLTCLLALVDGSTRETVRQAALAALGEDPAHADAAELVERLTRDPRVVFLEQHGACGTVLAGGPETPQ